ncbi:hypothetical protein ACHAXR_005011 [Thalassiosira sp. AJA248-18]
MTPAHRLRNLQQLATDFSIHLKTSPGTILSPNLRLGVAICARDALLQCKTGCHRALAEEVCLRPSSSFYDYCREMKHEPAFPVPKEEESASTSANDNIKDCLVNIVHAIICHQNRLDTIWYEDAIAALRSCGVLTEYAKEMNSNENDEDDEKEKEMEVASGVVFCEIVLIAAMSHGIHSIFLTLSNIMEDSTMPPLPSWEDMMETPGPTNIRFTSLLHLIRRDDLVAHAIFFRKRDLNTNSPEYSKIEKDVWKELDHKGPPFQCTKFSPCDNNMFGKVMDVLYLTKKEMALLWYNLNPSTHCSSVTSTTTFLGYGSSLDTTFDREKREKALIHLGSAVATLPMDMEKVQIALQEVKSVGGMELAMEATAVAGAYETITKVVDATGIKLPPQRIQRVISTILFVIKHKVTFGLVVASLVVALFAASTDVKS